MSHSHHHGEFCSTHKKPNFGKAFLVGILLNALFILIEVIWGLKANSLALLADATHNAGDVVALAIAWIASILVKKEPSDKFTYGLRGSTIIASLLNAAMLLVIVGGIAWESISRIFNPEEAASITVMVVAGIGVIINGITAWFFVSGKKDDLNIRGAYLHMLSDAIISIAVVISGLIIYKTGILWIDPLASLGVAIVIIFSTWGLFKDSMKLALQAVPENIDIIALKEYLSNLDNVKEVHDLHVWAISTMDIAASFHLVMKNGHPGDCFIKDVSDKLNRDFKIGHSTVQIELGDTDHECHLASDRVV